jgi:hypothetical protein
VSTGAEQFFMAPPSFKFQKIGDEVSGFIVHQEVRQETEFNTNKPKFWDDGRPKMQLVVTLRTNNRESPDDDGLRRWFIKGKSMTDAVRDALRTAHARGFETDGWARCVYVGDGLATANAQAPKLYLAEYRRPTPQAAQQAQGYPQVPQLQPMPVRQAVGGEIQGFQAGNGFQQQPQAAPPF